MEHKHNKKLVPIAKTLRKNMTKEERRLLYDFLRIYPIKFLRQKIIGKFIVDFYCASAKIVIELDGSQHYEDKKMQEDLIRTRFLEEYGLKVIRIPNNQINLDFAGVCKHIDIMVRQSIN